MGRAGLRPGAEIFAAAEVLDVAASPVLELLGRQLACGHQGARIGVGVGADHEPALRYFAGRQMHRVAAASGLLEDAARRGRWILAEQIGGPLAPGDVAQLAGLGEPAAFQILASLLQRGRNPGQELPALLEALADELAARSRADGSDGGSRIIACLQRASGLIDGFRRADRRQVAEDGLDVLLLLLDIAEWPVGADA